MSPTEQYTLVTGAVLPAIIAVIQQPKWSTQVKTAVALAVEALVAYGQQYLTTTPNPNPLFLQFLAVAALTIVFHEGVYKPTGVDKFIENITSKGGTDA